MFPVPVYAVGLDGNAQSSGCVNNHGDAFLTTVSSPDVIVADLYVANSAPTVTFTDTAGLAWTLRNSVSDAAGVELFEYYAIAKAVLSNDNISASNNQVANCNLTVYGVNGAKTSNLWDSAADGSNTGKSSAGLLLNVTVSSLRIGEMIIGFGHNQGTCTAGAGFTLVRSGSGFCAEFGFFGPNSQVFVSMKTSAGTEWQILAGGIFSALTGGQNLANGLVIYSSFFTLIFIAVGAAMVLSLVWLALAVVSKNRVIYPFAVLIASSAAVIGMGILMAISAGFVGLLS